MLQKITSFILIILLFSVGSVNLAYASNSREEKEAALAAKVKEGISKLGIGEDARVEVKLRDKTKLKGYISEAGENSFVIANAKTGESTTVAYSAAKQVKGNNLNLGVKIAIGVAIFIVAFVVLVSLGFRGATDH